MSGIEDPGTPPELPQEYAEVYREAYLRALEADPVPEADVPGRPAATPVVPAPGDRGPGIPRLWWVVAAVVLLVAAAYVVGQLLSDDSPASTGALSTPGAATAGPAKARPTHKATPVWGGAVLPVAIEAAQASCTAPPGVDSSNRPVSYAAVNAIDDDASTAWRCNGKARGQTITFSLPDDVDVAEIGLVPGYAKTDPASGTDRYAENNRITRVRWTLRPGVVIEQELDPSPENRSVQSIRVPRTATGSVTLEILSVAGGARNTTAISSVLIAAAY